MSSQKATSVAFFCCKSLKPKAPIWKAAVTAGLSNTHDFELSILSKPTPGNRHKRINLAIMGPRDLNQGRVISENAARGIFPSYKKCSKAVPIIWKDLYERISELNKLNEIYRQARTDKPS
jgi:hypothetical protein